MLAVERSAATRELVLELAQPDERTVVVQRPADAAIVLGSTQPDGDVDGRAAEAAGLSVVRRRSGGGAVFVGPGRQHWLDLFVPSGDPLHEQDVTRAAYPIGDAWVEALVAAGLPRRELAVHRGALVKAPHSRRLCFLGLGPGEVLWGGRKVVGLSQRRSRAGAWFFTMAPLRTAPAREAGLLTLDAAGRAEVAAALERDVRVLPALDDLERHLLAALGAR